MAAFGMHILTHMGFVTGQTAGIAVLITHVSGLPFSAINFVVTLPCLGLAWHRMGGVDLVRIEPGLAAILFGLLFGIAALAAIRHGGSIGGLSVLWIELQDRTGFPAGHAQLLSDLVIFGLARADHAR